MELKEILVASHWPHRSTSRPHLGCGSRWAPRYKLLEGELLALGLHRLLDELLLQLRLAEHHPDLLLVDALGDLGRLLDMNEMYSMSTSQSARLVSLPVPPLAVISMIVPSNFSRMNELSAVLRAYSCSLLFKY